MNFKIVPKTAFRFILFLIGLLLVANVVGWGIRLATGHANLFGLIPLFDFNAELNIPTLYSSFALLVCSLLLLLITLKQREAKRPWVSWAGLSLIFAFLSLDEVASIHERLTEPVRDSLNTSGLLFYAWVIPYFIAFVVLGVLYLNFFFRLPARTRFLFTVSAILFVTGAVGMELLGGWRAETHGEANLIYCLMYTVEELLEMIGAATFIYALLGYMVHQFGEFRITVKANAGPAVPATGTATPAGGGA